MKYLDYAAFGEAFGAYGAASSAYAEASRARAEVAALWEENQRLREDIDSQKYKQDFQHWVEELIYQFAKTVKAITDTPGEPVNDFIDLASFSYLIKEKKLDTSLISGFENKEKFEQTSWQAQKLIANLEKKPQVQGYIRQQEKARVEREGAQRQAHRREEQQKKQEVAGEIAKIKSALKVLYLLIGVGLLSLVLLSLTTISSDLYVLFSGTFAVSAGGVIVWLCLDAKHGWWVRSKLVKINKKEGKL
jgi:hypothetical protein